MFFLQLLLASTRPYTDFAVPSSFRQVAVLQPDTLNNAGFGTRHPIFDSGVCTGAAIPMATLGLVVDLDHIFARCADDVTGIEHHTRDWSIVGISIEDGPHSKIPDLYQVLEKETPWTICRKTYPDASVCAACDKISIIKLQACHRTSMSNQTAMNLSTSEIP